MMKFRRTNEEILLQNRLDKLKYYHPKDDDPYGRFYTVAEQRQYLRDAIKKIKNYRLK